LDNKSNGVFIVGGGGGGIFDDVGILDFFAEDTSDFLVGGVVSLLEDGSSFGAILYT